MGRYTKEDALTLLLVLGVQVLLMLLDILTR